MTWHFPAVIQHWQSHTLGGHDAHILRIRVRACVLTLPLKVQRLISSLSVKSLFARRSQVMLPKPEFVNWLGFVGKELGWGKKGLPVHVIKCVMHIPARSQKHQWSGETIVRNCKQNVIKSAILSAPNLCLNVVCSNCFSWANMIGIKVHTRYQHNNLHWASSILHSVWPWPTKCLIYLLHSGCLCCPAGSMFVPRLSPFLKFALPPCLFWFLWFPPTFCKQDSRRI